MRMPALLLASALLIGPGMLMPHASSAACPAPRLCEEINEAAKHCLQNPKNGRKTDKFVGLLEKSMEKYDCRREDDEKAVPVWWLCEGKGEAPVPPYYGWFQMLSNQKSKRAKALFGSRLFRETLQGRAKEMFYEKSLKLERRLKK